MNGLRRFLRQSSSSSATTAPAGGEPDSASKAAKTASSRKKSSSSAHEAAGAAYEASRALALFNTYADTDAAEPAIGPEGLERLCADAGIDMGGVQPLLLAWQLDAKVFARLAAPEWRTGTAALKADTLPRLKAVLEDLEALLFVGTQPRARPAGPTAYARDRIVAYAQNVEDSFMKFYNYCFTLAKADARNIDVETATALWSVALAPRYPMAGEWIEFVTEKGTFKGVNKDLWSMVLEFCQTVVPTLENFEQDGAWPTAIDDFVEWKKSRMMAE